MINLSNLVKDHIQQQQQKFKSKRRPFLFYFSYMLKPIIFVFSIFKFFDFSFLLHLIST